MKQKNWWVQTGVLTSGGDPSDDLSKDPVPAKWMAGYCDFLTHYDETAMELRTSIHPVIAAYIQKRIDKYPDHVHLISVGDAHVYTNPLYLYIKPPTGTFGIADQSAW